MERVEAACIKKALSKGLIFSYRISELRGAIINETETTTGNNQVYKKSNAVSLNSLSKNAKRRMRKKLRSKV